jgi:hypothetical protein
LRKTLIGLAFALICVTQAWAVDLTTFKRFLLPVYTSRTSGAFGSEWKSFLLVYNGASTSAEYYPVVCPVVPCAIGIPPHEANAPFTLYAASGTPGRLFYISNDVADKVWFNLRVQDLSRESQTWGTDIPVISDERLLTGTAELLSIPLDDRFRQTLRVYDPDATGTGAVVVRVFPGVSGPELAELTLPLTVDQSALFPGIPGVTPGYGAIPWLAQRFPEAAGQTTIRIEIEPATPGLRYWAFVSVGNNETQHVTTIVPQQ